jgi:hypothetical protein
LYSIEQGIARGIVSPPIRVRWAGWESDTTRLWRAGWEISAEQDYYMDVLRIALKHKEAQMYGISNPIPYREIVSAGPFNEREILAKIGLDMAIASDITLNIVDTSLPKFEPVEAKPTFIERKIYHLEDLKIFKPSPKDAQEVLLDMPTIDEVLKYALKLQEPIQAELREKKRRAEKFAEKARVDSELKAELRLVA